MTCLFSNDFSNVTKSSNLAVRHFKGEGSPSPLRPARLWLVQYLIKNDLDFRQSSSTKWYYNQDISRWKPAKVSWRLQQKMYYKVSNRKKGKFLLPRFCLGCCRSTSFVKASNCLWRVILTKCHPSIKLPLTYPNHSARPDTENVIQFWTKHLQRHRWTKTDTDGYRWIQVESRLP